MRVTEALDAIDKLVSMNPPSNRRKIQEILDAVWLNAYMEGESGMFSEPEENDITPVKSNSVVHWLNQ